MCPKKGGYTEGLLSPGQVRSEKASRIGTCGNNSGCQKGRRWGTEAAEGTLAKEAAACAKAQW